MHGYMGMGIVGALCGVLLLGCGKKDDGGGAKGNAPPAAAGSAGQGQSGEAKPPTGDQPSAKAAGAWATAPTPLKAAWESSGEATRGKVLKGTFYVGPDAVRLDIDNHPNAGHAVSFIRVHGENELWQIDATTKEYDRALSGDWEHDVIPQVIDEDDEDDLRACPFGRASDECKKLGAESVAGHAVEKWQRRNRTLWVAPSLRITLKEEYTPFRNNPKTQVVVLTDVQTGPQDPALFKLPTAFKCLAQSFCDGAPK